ncbi:MAG: GNAT family N-acetyltransferase [Oscillospiraceae bacterium]|nr:GNAT family N-acetyltransferase [Oscillospiraceae bacterium]
MHTKSFSHLAQDVRKIRIEVFVEEQGFVYEFDDIDDYAVHMALYDGKKPVAICRYFPGEEPDTFVFGRLAVIKEYRGGHVGLRMIQEAEKEIMAKGGTTVILHAQCRAKRFYEKAGYQAYGELGEEEGIPHIWMRKNLR